MKRNIKTHFQRKWMTGKWTANKPIVVTMLCMMLSITGCANPEDVNQDSSKASVHESAQQSIQELTQQSEQGTTQQSSQESQQPYVLQFSALTSEGEEFTSDRLAESKLTMINVWGTFCGPCLNEMPDLGEIAAQYDASEFQLIGIVSDVMEGASESELENLKGIIEETGATYPHLLLNEELYLNLVGASEYVPTTYFFNQDAELLTYVVGAKSKEDWISIIEELKGVL